MSGIDDWSAIDAAKYAQRTIAAWDLLGGDGSPTLGMAKVHAEDVLTAIEVANRLAREVERLRREHAQELQDALSASNRRSVALGDADNATGAQTASNAILAENLRVLDDEMTKGLSTDAANAGGTE